MSSFKLNLRTYKNVAILIGSLLGSLILIQAIFLGMVYFKFKDTTLSSPNEYSLMVNGFDILITLIIFIMACGNFKPNFNMQIQNSVSRKAYFKNTLLSGTVFCAITALSFTVIYAVVNTAETSFCLNMFNFEDEVIGMSDEMFGSYYHSLFFPANNLTFPNLIWTFLLMFTDCVFGFVIGSLFSNISYRLPNDLVKFFVFFTPIFLFMFVLPIVDMVCFNDTLCDGIINFIDTINGYTTNEPWKNVCSNVAGSAILAAIFFLVLRKTRVKKA